MAFGVVSPLDPLRREVTVRRFDVIAGYACGPFAVVDERGGAASVTRYFDARGHLVAAQAESPEIRAAMKWGDVPKCTTSEPERICPAPAKPPPKKRKK